MCGLDLWPKGHISYIKPWFQSTHYMQLLCWIKHTRHQCTKEEFVLWAVWQILRIFLTLTLDFKVISIFWDLRCNFHMICNYCSKYEYARSKNERGVRVLSRRQVLSISDIDLWLPYHISDVKPLYYFRHYEQPLCNPEAMLYLKSLMHVTHLKILKK